MLCPLQAGSSLALAVMNCAVPWPRSPDWAYPDPLHQLVRDCLAHDPAARPTAAQLCERVAALVQAGLPDPPALAKAGPKHVSVHVG